MLTLCKKIKYTVHAKMSCFFHVISGITGNVSIDANGDRNGDYSLLDMNPETGRFQVRASQQ